ncbi:hypothetical protein C7W88_02405 [Novosphingobium sp. THN1]|nr:hypothetical protein C7W88_02405 [Novosphingobium sp. THN1]
MLRLVEEVENLVARKLADAGQVTVREGEAARWIAARLGWVELCIKASSLEGRPAILKPFPAGFAPPSTIVCAL